MPPDPENDNAARTRGGAGEAAQASDAVQGNHTGIVARWHLLGVACCDARLSHGDVAVLWWILDRIGSDGWAWPGYGRLAKDTGLHRATVARCIARLVDHGYLIRQTGGRGKSNRYRAGSSVDATSRTDAPSRIDATGVVAQTRLSVVAPTRPESASLNLPIEPAPKAPAIAIALPVGRFSEFWKAYPRKEAKPSAEKAWKRAHLDNSADHILADIQARIADPAMWTDRRFIPLPATYINGRRWLDEWERTATKPTAGTIARDSRTEQQIEAENMAALESLRIGGRHG